MDKPKPRLVYSSEASRCADAGRDAWGFENARQLSLFEFQESFNLHILAVGDYKFHSFQSYMEVAKPKYILDTRSYPSFFSIFETFNKALSEFQRKEVVYDRIPIDWIEIDDGCRRWELRESLGCKLQEIQRSMCVNAKSSIILVQSEHIKSLAINVLRPIVQHDTNWNLISA